MYASVIFIDQSEAKIFKLKPGGVESETLHPRGGTHHSESQGRNHTKKEGDAEHFYHQVAEHMVKDPASRWLVLGPGLAKTHFQHHVQSHHAASSKKIVAVEALGKSSDGEILDYARTFFKKWDQFNLN